MLSLLARFAPSLLPGLGAFLNPWVLLAVAAVAAGVWFHGYATGRDQLDDYINEQAQAAVRVVVKQAAATEKIVTRYVKVKGATVVVTRTVEKEVVRYADANPGLCLDADWRRLHDTAAANAVPGAAGGAAGEGGAAPPAAVALQSVAENYAACHRTADRLDALQDWVRAQRAIKP